MKKTITFEGDSHEDNEEFLLLEKGPKYHSALFDIANWLRGEYKHGDREAIPVEEIHTKFYNILSEHAISL